MTKKEIFTQSEKDKVLNSIYSNRKRFRQNLDENMNYNETLKTPILKNIDTKDLKNILEFSIFISQNSLDITSCFLIYLNPYDDYQKLYSLKNLVIHLNEGYKRLIHFSPNAFSKTLIFNLIKGIVDKNVDLKPEYDELIKRLNTYSDNYQTHNFKELRVLFVHYDGLPSNIYQQLKKIDQELLIKNFLEYNQIQTQLILYLEKLTLKIAEKF